VTPPEDPSRDPTRTKEGQTRHGKVVCSQLHEQNGFTTIKHSLNHQDGVPFEWHQYPQVMMKSDNFLKGQQYPRNADQKPSTCKQDCKQESDKIITLASIIIELVVIISIIAFLE
jgi:hypothetical protein